MTFSRKKRFGPVDFCRSHFLIGCLNPQQILPTGSSIPNVPMRRTRGNPRRGVDLIQDWRTEEVRHASANPVEAGLRCDAAT